MSLVLITVISTASCASTSGTTRELSPLPVKKEDTRPPRLASHLEPMAYFYFMRGYMAKLENDPETALANFNSVLQIDPDATFVKREAVEVLFSLNMIDEGTRLAENILAESPNDLVLLKALGQAYSSKNEADKAISIFRRVVVLDPEDMESALHLAVLYGSRRNYNAARKSLKGLMDSDRDSAASALYYVGVMALSAGDLDDAESIFLETRKYGLESDGLYLNLGAIKDRQNNRDKAEQYYLKALELNPGNLAAMENLTQLYIKSGREKEALGLLQEMEKSRPGDMDIMKRKALLLLSVKDFSGAADILKEVIRQAPDETTLRYYLGLAYEESGKYDEAVTEYRKLIAAEPGNVKPYLNLGYLYTEMELYSEAIEVYRSLIEVSEPMAEYYVYLGRVYILSGDEKAAEKVLKEGLKKFDDSDELHFNMAVLYEKQDRFDDMVTHLKRAIELNPGHADAMNFLGYSYAEKGTNLDEALRLIKSSLALKPDNGYITDSLGWTYYMMGKYDKALSALKEATRMVDSDPVIFEHLGDAYKASSNNKEAIKAWKRSLEVLNPEHLGEPEATDLKKRVQDKIKQSGEALAD